VIPPRLQRSQQRPFTPRYGGDYTSRPEVRAQPEAQAATLQQTQKPSHITTGSAAEVTADRPLPL